MLYPVAHGAASIPPKEEDEKNQCMVEPLCYPNLAPQIPAMIDCRSMMRMSLVSWTPLAGLLLALLGERAVATPDLRFDVVTFCCGRSNSNQVLRQGHFDHLNFPTPNGHYLAMGNDDHRAELATNGNVLAIYCNTLDKGWPTNDAATTAASIQQYSTNLFTRTGPRPDWIVSNEIASQTWTADSTYRTWIRDVVHALKNTYGFSAIVYCALHQSYRDGCRLAGAGRRRLHRRRRLLERSDRCGCDRR